jgi:FkbM family methyltransferase
MNPDDRERIETALACRDCEGIPKVRNAGEVLESGTPHGPMQIMHNGLKVYTESHYGAYNVEVIKGLNGHHEPQEEKCFYEVLQRIEPGSAMLELGSFWGYYSMWFQHEVKGANNYLMEPMPEPLEWGRRNFRLNGMQGDFTRAAVGSESKTEVDFEHWDGKQYELPQISVDGFFEVKEIDRLAILHSDVQGAEYEMLLGARRFLDRRAVDYVFISTHAEHLHQECMYLLRDFGYQICAQHTPAESYSVDGLIVASSPDGDPLEVKISKRRSFESMRKKMRAKLRHYVRTAF